MNRKVAKKLNFQKHIISCHCVIFSPI